MEMHEKVRQFVLGSFVDSGEDLDFDDDANIFELGFVDSSFAMALICYVEGEFSVQVTDDDLDLANFSTVNRIVGFVDGKRNA